jgi:enoyl-CoA hydratase/carnithine racemase
VGQARAAELLLLGEMFSASTAREYGLVNAVVPAAEVYPLARSKAQRLAALPPQAVRTTKQLLKRPIQDAAWASLQHELGVFGGLLRGAEAREAMTAFTEKRKPDFSRFS